MPFFLQIRVHVIAIACSLSLFCVSGVYSAMDPRFELDQQSLSALKNSPNTPKQPAKRTASDHAASASSNGTVYTVRPGDHLFKILMRDYGLSNKEAESFIEEIKRENNIYDIKRLKIGKKITIPPVRRRADGSLKLQQSAQSSAARGSYPDTAPEQSLKLESPVPVLSGQETVSRAQNIWKQIVPTKTDHQKPLSLQTPVFSLSLDSERYPVFARMDGGRIILDQHGTIPPLVKSLIEEKDASVRIVAESPAVTRKLMSSLLEAAGFYSVEENFNMEFGTDPKLTVQADFKVEKNADSLIKQDVVIVSNNRTMLPSALGDFLKKEGFSLYEPFASLKPLAQRDSRAIHHVSAKKQSEIVDSILSAFSVSPERDHRVDVFAADNNGITLSVKAERYFIRGGQRYVVTTFDGDPINYTLFRILETKGYNVVILEKQDEFRKISEKIISRMKIKGVFAQHKLLQDSSAGYSLQMSGFKLDDALLPGGGIFLTDRTMDRIVRDLFTGSGFAITDR